MRGRVRVYCILLTAVLLGGCFGKEVLVKEHRVVCPPEKPQVGVLPFPEYEGKAFSRAGVKSLLSKAKAANDSRDVALDLWVTTWEQCQSP